jgi:hypothetical protein
MDERQLKNLRSSVAELYRDLYASEGDAFAHAAIEEYFDLDAEEALEYCDVGGSGDKGVDAFWIDELERRAVLVQAKWSKANSSFAAPVVREAESAYRWLERIAEGKASDATPRLIDAARQLFAQREEDPEFPVHIFVIVAGTFTSGAREEALRAKDDFGLRPVELHLVDLDELLVRMDERASRRADQSEVHPDVTLPLVRGEFYEHDGSPKALVATVLARDLAAAAHQWSYRLFMRNLRFFLPGRQRGSVNVGIKRSLESSDGREHFWYYNNGIAVVCDSYKVNGDSDPPAVAIKGMQIVNGAQTTSSLGNALDLLRDDTSTRLLVRVIAAPDEDLQESITFYNNRQNAIRDRDLQSNDNQQGRLHEEFLLRNPPWFYERKRGEWSAHTARDAALKKKVGKNRIDNERAAQAAYAFFNDPGQARADKKGLFQSVAEGGKYEDVFNDGTTTAYLLVPFRASVFVSAEKASLLRELRQIDARKPTTNELKILARQWIKFADQFILGTIGFYVRERGGVETDRLEELLAGNFDGMVEGAYRAAIRDLQPLFSRKARDAVKADTVFSAANYVKGNWRPEVVEHLVGEWDSRLEDPLAGVPMLADE